MPLPKSFDQNEWFIIISFTLSVLVFILLPKRIPITITVLLLIFSSVVARLFDHLLAGPTLDLYDLNDTGKFELFDLFTYLLYSPFGYFFIYFYEKWELRGYQLFIYIVTCTTTATAYEWVNHYFNVFNYKGWKISYSFTVYLAIQPIMLLFYEIIKKEYQKEAGK